MSVNPVTIPAVLTREMARNLNRIALRVAVATADRNTLIREASKSGASLREIGDAVGLSHVGVKKIIDKGEEQ